MSDVVMVGYRRCVRRAIMWRKRRFYVVLGVVFVTIICLQGLVSILSVKTLQNRSTEKPVPLYYRKDSEFGIYKTGPPRLCPEIPLDLKGKIPVLTDSLDMQSVEERHPELMLGGSWKPKRCTPAYNIAIVVPYRDRELHLLAFLRHMHPFLQKQHLSYTIFVVEQTHSMLFNRGFLLNVGFIEATAIDDYHCFFFHDVDLLPENDRNIYTCSTFPRLLAVARSNSNYTLPYRTYFGGVTSMTRRHYLKINGYSNRFYGWGGEDDDAYTRIHEKALLVDRINPDFGRYFSLNHTQAGRQNNTEDILVQNQKEHFHEGLSTTRYRLLKLERKRLFTWILADPVLRQTSESPGS
ncbi:beta-1,4-galactosyltransferase 4-like [Liolophura sinensis]|uniref:beta-1,4-galactosyltransferase 4-like n=1 Tax=Liolophura sinensis TaxID=3198878 RepID=UPI003158DE06